MTSKSGKWVVLMAAAAFGGACAAGAPAQVLLNPGFETWSGSVTADNWTQYNTTGTVTPMKGSSFTGSPSVTPYGGLECQRVKLASGGCEGGVYQRFSSTPGNLYAVSAYLLTRITSAGETVEAKLGLDPTGATIPGAGTVWSSTVLGDSAWTQKTVNITATGPYVTVFLNGRHPSGTSSQVNVFFDDASATGCTPPAAPTSPAADPPAIYPGGSSTLSASVGSGCTVDWYPGVCDGTPVGSGTSLVVTPFATTTYYPRARDTVTGCASTNCGDAVTVTVTAPPVVTITPSNMAEYGWQIATSNGGSASFTVGGPVASEYAGDPIWPTGRGGIYATCREISGAGMTPSTVWLGLDKLYVSPGVFKSLELIRLNQIKKIEYRTYVPTIPTILNKIGELHYPRQPIHLAIATTKDAAEPYANRRWYVSMPWPLWVWGSQDRFGHWDDISAAPWTNTNAGFYCAWLGLKWNTWEELIAARGNEKLVPTSTYWDASTPRDTRGWKSCGYDLETDPVGDINSTGTGTAINFYVGARKMRAELQEWYNEPDTAWWRESYGFRGHLDAVTIGVDFGAGNGGYVECTYDFEPEPTTPDLMTVALSQRSAILPGNPGFLKLNPIVQSLLISRGYSGADKGAIRLKCFGKVLSYANSGSGAYFDLDDVSVSISDPYDPPYPWYPEQWEKEILPQGQNLWLRPLPVRVHVPYEGWPIPSIGEYWSAVGYPVVLSWDNPIPDPVHNSSEVCGQLYLYSTIENCQKVEP